MPEAGAAKRPCRPPSSTATQSQRDQMDYEPTSYAAPPFTKPRDGAVHSQTFATPLAANSLIGANSPVLYGQQQKAKTRPTVVLRRSTDGLLVKLVCNNCQRGDFSSIQGFLNHCRIAHKVDYKSHDAAAIDCGRPVDENEVVSPMSNVDSGVKSGLDGRSEFSAAQAEDRGPWYSTGVPSRPKDAEVPAPADEEDLQEALDASRGMLAVSQADISPRNIYGNYEYSTGRGRDSYAEAAQPLRRSPSISSMHSTHSDVVEYDIYGNVTKRTVITKTTTYYSASMSEGSAVEASDFPPRRTLPRPDGLLSGLGPAPQSMMGQLSSKVSGYRQGKHKCKICDKRFVRPTSLQTHMYSHTGEKPFACEVEGCGKHFSVVSNLRRHRKVHRGEARVAASDADAESE